MKDLETAAKEHCSKQGKEPSELDRLVLDSKCKSVNVKGLEAYPNLTDLSLACLGINTLECFPCLPKLTHLNLSDNRISAGLEHLVSAGLTNLKRLELANNRITRVEVLEPLKALQQLRRLDVLACPLESVPDYDKKVFTMLPELEYLDNVDRQGNERDGDEEDDDFEDEEGGEEGGDAEGGADGEEEYDDEGDDDEGEEGLPEYAQLVGDAPLGDDEDEYEGEEGEDDDDDDDEGGEGGEGEEPDEDEEGEEGGAKKRKRAEDDEAGPDDE